MKLHPYPHTMSLNESFQANSMKFAFVNPVENDFQMIHSWVQCREYFNELLMKNHHPEYEFVETYGFQYKHAEFPLDLSATRIAIQFMNQDQKNTFVNNLSWLHKIEEANNCDLTVVHELNEKEVVIIANKMWIQKCLLLNIYTLLLKLLALDIANHTSTSFFTLKIKDREPSEVQYIRAFSIPSFNKLLENCNQIAKIPCKYVDGAEELRPAYAVHGQSGILYIKDGLSNSLSDHPLKKLLIKLNSILTKSPKNSFIGAVS